MVKSYTLVANKILLKLFYKSRHSNIQMNISQPGGDFITPMGMLI